MQTSKTSDFAIIVTVDRMHRSFKGRWIEDGRQRIARRRSYRASPSGICRWEIDARSMQPVGRERKDLAPVRCYAYRMFELGR